MSPLCDGVQRYFRKLDGLAGSAAATHQGLDENETVELIIQSHPKPSSISWKLQPLNLSEIRDILDFLYCSLSQSSFKHLSHWLN